MKSGKSLPTVNGYYLVKHMNSFNDVHITMESFSCELQKFSSYCCGNSTFYTYIDPEKLISWRNLPLAKSYLWKETNRKPNTRKQLLFLYPEDNYISCGFYGRTSGILWPKETKDINIKDPRKFYRQLCLGSKVDAPNNIKWMSVKDAWRKTQ